MIDRCTSPDNASWHHYGAKGITVHPSLMTIEGFIAEIGPRPSLAHTIDRFPNKKGHYEPGNIRWATWEEQNRNLSSNRLITFNGRTQCQAAWAEEIGISDNTLCERFRCGWSVERALTQPLRDTSRRLRQP